MQDQMQPLEPQEPGIPNALHDNEGAMAKADLYKLAKYSMKLFKDIQDDTELESWVQAKITKAADYIASVYHYLEYEMKFSEYGAKLENSDIYNENEKILIQDLLVEARKKVKELKIIQAQKLSESKSPKAKKDWDGDGEIESEKDEVIGSRRKAAGLDKCVKETSEAEFRFNRELEKHDERTKNYGIPTSKDGKYAVKPKTKKPEKVKESAPSADLTKKEKSAVVKKAKAGKDIGKPGKGFEKVANKATKKYGSKEKGEKVAAAAMWKNIKESVEHNINEGFFSKTPEEYAKTDPTMAELLKLRQQYQGTEWSSQIDQRIQQLLDRYETGYSAPQDAQGNPIKVLPPADWARKNPSGLKETGDDYWDFSTPSNISAAPTGKPGKGIMKMSPAEYNKAKERMPFLFKSDEQSRQDIQRAVQPMVDKSDQRDAEIARKQAAFSSNPDALIRQQQNMNKAFGTGSSDEAYRKNVDSDFRESVNLTDIIKLSGLK